MADVAGTNVWPELDKRTAGVAQNVLWQRMSTDRDTWLTTSSSAATHWSVSSTAGSLVGLQPYQGTSSRMMLKGPQSALIQIAQDDMDTTFFWHPVWLSTDGSGNAVFAGSSSEEALYFGSSSSTAIFALSTTQASTSIYIGEAMPMNTRGIRIWEAE